MTPSNRVVTAFLAVLVVTVLAAGAAQAEPAGNSGTDANASTDVYDRLAGADGPTPPSAPEAARLVTDHRQASTDVTNSTRVASHLQQAERNLELARDLRGIRDRGPGLSPTIDRAKIVQRRTDDLDTVPTDPNVGPSHDTLEAALADLAAAHGTDIPPGALDDLDALDSTQRDALTAHVDAFLAFEAASSTALDGAPADAPSKQDLGTLLTARHRLLESTALVSDFLSATPNGRPASDCVLVQQPPVFSIALGGCDNTYTQDYALQIDDGGEDTYYNNAGGSGLHADRFLLFNCGVEPNPDGGAAALVDLGRGDDTYGDPDNPRTCGANGGGPSAPASSSTRPATTPTTPADKAPTVAAASLASASSSTARATTPTKPKAVAPTAAEPTATAFSSTEEETTRTTPPETAPTAGPPGSSWIWGCTREEH